MPYDLKKAMSMQYTERKEPELVKLEKKGDTFGGVLIAMQNLQLKDGPAVKAVFEMPNGEQKAMFLSAQLKMRISKRDLGHYVKMQHDGEDETVGKEKGNAMKLYRVIVSDCKIPGFTDLEVSDDDISNWTA